MIYRTILCFYNRHRSQIKDNKVKSLCLLIILVSLYLIFGPKKTHAPRGHVATVIDSHGNVHEYNSKTSPMVFIGGHPRSGTTLMRAILDSHHLVRCGEETRIIPRLVSMRENWFRNNKESERLVQAGIDHKVVDAAMASFLLEVIANHGEPSPVLCDKDPLNLKWGSYIGSLFPNSKWLFMMRDARAVIHSVITRNVSISGYNMAEPKQCLGRWNKNVEQMNKQCNDLGSTRCMLVYYEQLVLHPKKWISMILDFLDLPWDENVLHHDKSINKPGGVRVSMVERSSDQIIKPINVDALTSWVGFYEDDVLDELDSVAPMLRKFGYNPDDNNPVYGIPDSDVAENTNDLHKQKDYWELHAKDMLKEMDKRKEAYDSE